MDNVHVAKKERRIIIILLIIIIITRYDYNLTIMKWSLPNQIMCFLLPVDSKPTADKMSVNKSKATFEIEQCWMFAVLLNLCGIVAAIWKWRSVKQIRCQKSMRDIIIYLHMKCRWNQTMLNLCGIVAAILKMATGRNFSKSGINSGHHCLPTY